MVSVQTEDACERFIENQIDEARMKKHQMYLEKFLEIKWAGEKRAAFDLFPYIYIRLIHVNNAEKTNLMMSGCSKTW